MRVTNRRKRRAVSVPCTNGKSILHSEAPAGRLRQTVPTVCFADIMPGHHLDISEEFRQHPRIIDLKKRRRIHIPEVEE